MSYDIIGDIHGDIAQLKALLRGMGYAPAGAYGAWTHPERTAVFVGDLIDRGLGQLEVIDIVQRMVYTGSAKATMGNHELNAIAFYLLDHSRPGEHLRPRHGSIGVKNRAQHAAFLVAVGEDSELHRKAIAWFLTLPLWLELPGLNVVHACMDQRSMRALRGWLAPGLRLTADHMQSVTKEGHWAGQAVDLMLKGPEFRLPPGHHYRDHGGQKRSRSRMRWWSPDATTVRELAVLDADSLCKLPDFEVEVNKPEIDVTTPTFFGHYALAGRHMPLARTMACVDYGAGKGGPLVAYRWNGERELRASGFVTAQSSAQDEPTNIGMAA
jgi:hypothetical protein